MLVSGSYFPLLGVQPELGRMLGPGDDAVAGEASAAVLSHGYWSDALGADPAVLGKTLVVNGKPLTIVGVAPPEFRGTTPGFKAEVFVPITFLWLNRPSATPIPAASIRSSATAWSMSVARRPPVPTAGPTRSSTPIP